jgi:hypothetical protein
MLIDHFFAPGRGFWGSRYPILRGAITRICDLTMVGCICNEGGFGPLTGRI